MALKDIVKVPAGTVVTFKTTKPGAEVTTYVTQLFRVTGDNPVLAATWPPATTEGPGGKFTMDLTGNDDAYVAVMTVTGTKAASMKEALAYTPPPPPPKPYVSPVIEGMNTTEWTFLLKKA